MNICEICGKKFIPKCKAKKHYCSYKCHGEAKSMNKELPLRISRAKSQKYIIPNEISKELCYLIGVSYGDGYLWSHPRKRGIGFDRSFGLTTKDLDFVLKFKDCLERVFSIKLNLKKLWNSKYQRFYHRVTTQIKEIIDFLMSIKNKKWVEKLSKEFKIEVLKGIFDSEGSVVCSKKSGLVIRIGIKLNKNIVQSLLDELKIPYKKYYNARNGMFSFNFLGRNGIFLHNLFGRFTIERKENTFLNYIPINWKKRFKQFNVERDEFGRFKFWNVITEV